MKIIFSIFFLSVSFWGLSQENLLPESKIKEVENYINGKNYNQELAFFINFKIPSGKFRFFLINLTENKIIEKGIVAHGAGSVVSGSEKLQFSNTEGSYQSSLGKYEISNSYVGSFGKSYKLKGLDKTNSNAYKRLIVLHSLSCVPDKESENPTCLSLGCPMLSPHFFQLVEKYIDASKKPIILYAFY